MATYKVFFTNAGVPATGLSPTIPVLKRVDTQDDVTPPTVYEIGGGWYTFEHEPAQAQVGYVDGTATLANADRYIPIDLNVEDVYLDAPVANVPTVAEFEARSLVAADYTVVSDLPAAPDNAGIAAIKAKTDNLPTDPADESLVIAATNALASAISALPTAAAVADLPTVAEFEARSLPSADYTVVSDLPAAPDNAGIAALPTLAEIEASAVLAKEASLSPLALEASLAPLALEASLAPLALDATVAKDATVMKAANYTAPANPDVSRLASLPTLAEVEASTVLAKVSDLPESPDNAGIALLPTLAEMEASLVLVKVTDLPAAPDNTSIAAIKLKTDNLPASPAAAGDIPTVVAIADQVWDEPTSGHAAAGTTGKALTDAQSAGTPLDASGVRAAIGLASANLDTQLGGISTIVSDAAVAADIPTPEEIAAAVHDEAIEGAFSFRQLLRIFKAVIAGKSTGGGTSTVYFRDAADTKNRVIATVDANGNRTGISVDGT